jgi:hypothetical protein
MPAQTTSVHVPGESARRADHQARYHRESARDRAQSARAKRKTEGMAKRGVTLRGRSLVAAVLGAFVLVSLSIVWRRTIGIGESERLAQLDTKRVELEGERARLESEIRNSSTRQTLGATVERKLGMHIPTDKQVVILPRTKR